MTPRPETGSSLRVFSRDAQWTGLHPPFFSRYFRPRGGVGRMIGGAVAALVLLTLMLPAVAAATDRYALMALYNATGGSAWDDKMNWNSAADIGDWYGVTTICWRECHQVKAPRQ